VLAVGDVGFQKKCLQTMSDLRTGGKTVLFVSHNMAAVENLCSRAVWIDNGRIRQEGDPRDVIRAYLLSFARTRSARHDLRNLESRRGSGEVQYTGMEFLDRGGQPMNLVHSGDMVLFRLYYHAQKAITSPHFRVEIYTDCGTMITAVSTWATGCEIPHLLPGDGYVDLEVDFLNLMPGQYYLTLKIEAIGPVHYDLLDYCAVLDIEASDVYGSGKGIDNRHGIIFLPCRWRLDGLYTGHAIRESSTGQSRIEKSVNS